MHKASLSFNGVALCGIIALVLAVTLFFTKNPMAFIDPPLPDFSYQDTNGKPGHLYQFTDKAVTLHFWATWCGPCREELPELLQKAHASPQEVFLLISVDENKQDMLNFLKPYKALLSDNITIINDSDTAITRGDFNIDQFPETIILNKDKTVARHIYGMTDWGTN